MEGRSPNTEKQKDIGIVEALGACDCFINTWGEILENGGSPEINKNRLTKMSQALNIIVAFLDNVEAEKKADLEKDIAIITKLKDTFDTNTYRRQEAHINKSMVALQKIGGKIAGLYFTLDKTTTSASES